MAESRHVISAAPGGAVIAVYDNARGTFLRFDVKGRRRVKIRVRDDRRATVLEDDRVLKAGVTAKHAPRLRAGVSRDKGRPTLRLLGEVRVHWR